MLAPLTRWHIQNYKEANKMIHVEFWNISKYVSHQMSQNLQGMMQCTKRRARLWQGMAGNYPPINLRLGREGIKHTQDKTNWDVLCHHLPQRRSEVAENKSAMKWKRALRDPQGQPDLPWLGQGRCAQHPLHLQQNKLPNVGCDSHTECNKSRVKGTIQNKQKGLSPLALPNAFPCTSGNTGNVHEFTSIPAWGW